MCLRPDWRRFASPSPPPCSHISYVVPTPTALLQVRWTGFLRRYDVVHPGLAPFLHTVVRSISTQIYTAGGDLSAAFEAFDANGDGRV
jgi:hypothetical protein